VAMRKVLDERFGSRNGTVPLGNQQGNADASAYQNDSVNEYEVGKEYENHDVYSAESLQVELDTIRSEVSLIHMKYSILSGKFSLTSSPSALKAWRGKRTKVAEKTRMTPPRTVRSLLGRTQTLCGRSWRRRRK